MGRRYVVTAEEVATTTAQDFLQIKGAAGKILRILRVWWGNTDVTLVTNQQIASRCRFLPATVTDGTGGSTPAIGKMDAGDAAASFTAKCNSTGKATTGGTAAILWESGDNVFNGFEHIFSAPPIVGPSESFVFELLNNTSGTVTLSCGVEVEEIGG